MSCNLFRIENVSSLDGLAEVVNAQVITNRLGDSVLNLDAEGVIARLYLAKPENVLFGQVTSKPDEISCEDIVEAIKGVFTTDSI